jgi:hypothetical protein
MTVAFYLPEARGVERGFEVAGFVVKAVGFGGLPVAGFVPP